MPIRKVSVVTPIHNEEQSIPELVERITQTMEAWRAQAPGRDWEHLACDDHSSDGSLALLRKLAEANPRLRPVQNPRRAGQTGGFETGFRHATGDYIVTMDADLQNYPEDIPKLLEPIEQGRLDLTNAIRMRRQHSLAMILISKGGNLLIRTLLTCPVSDAASNFTALPAKFAKNLTMVENDHRYVIPIFVRRGLDARRIGDVETRHTARRHGASKYKVIKKALTGVPELFRFRTRLKQGFYDDKGPGAPQGQAAQPAAASAARSA